MSKPSLRSLLKANRTALRNANPKSRDRLRRKVKVFELAAQLRKESRAA